MEVGAAQSVFCLSLAAMAPHRAGNVAPQADHRLTIGSRPTAKALRPFVPLHWWAAPEPKRYAGFLARRFPGRTD